MKKLLITTIIALSVFIMQKASAQVSLNINIGTQPAWGPVGYDYVNYYYLPDIDAYYDVPTRQYVIFENNIWVHRSVLPSRYSYYNPYKSYKVVVNERTPWVRHTVIRNKYVTYKGRPSQVIIRNSHDAKYVKYRSHGNNGSNKNYNKVKVKSHGNDKGHGGGKSHGKDKH